MNYTFNKMKNFVLKAFPFQVRIYIAFVLLLTPITLNAQYIDDEKQVQKMLTTEQMRSMVDTFSMDKIEDLFRNIENKEEVNYTVQTLHDALIGKQFITNSLVNDGYKYIQRPDTVKKKKKKGDFIKALAVGVLLGGTNQQVDKPKILYDTIRYCTKLVAASQTNQLIRAEDVNNKLMTLVEIENTGSTYWRKMFVLESPEGKKYKFPGSEFYLFDISTYLAYAEQKAQKEYLATRIKPATEYKPWTMHEDFNQWYISIYKNEALRPRLKEIQFISLDTGDAVDGLSVELADDNNEFVAVKFNNPNSKGKLKDLNAHWVVSTWLDYLTKTLGGRKVIRPKMGDGSGKDINNTVELEETLDKAVLSTNYGAEWICTDLYGDDYQKTKFRVCMKTESGRNLWLGYLYLPEFIKDYKLPWTLSDYNGRWYYEAKAYRQEEAATKAEWARDEAKKQREQEARKKRLIQKFGKKNADLIMANHPKTGMTLEMIKEMQYLIKVVDNNGNNITLSLQNLFVGECYRIIVRNNKVILVTNTFGGFDILE